jgi:hypothetical protein
MLPVFETGVLRDFRVGNTFPHRSPSPPWARTLAKVSGGGRTRDQKSENPATPLRAEFPRRLIPEVRDPSRLMIDKKSARSADLLAGWFKPISPLQQVARDSGFER